MTAIDYIIIGIILISILFSLVRGFVREVFSLMAWIGAIYGAIKFSPLLEGRFISIVDHAGTRYALTFVIILVILVFTFSFIAGQISRFVKITGLSGTDRILGIFFGFARGLLIVSALILLAGVTPLKSHYYWSNAYFISELELAETIFSWIPIMSGQNKSYEE